MNDQPSPSGCPEVANAALEVTAAAKLLGARPKLKRNGRRRVKRTWTGFVDGERCWRGRLVILPDGIVAEVHTVCRGDAVVLLRQADGAAVSLPAIVPTKLLRLVKLQAAVVLGQQKLGVKEIKSSRKAAAARENGKQPARPGHRKRGRPRKSGPAWRRFVWPCKLASPRASMKVHMARMFESNVYLAECIQTARERDAAKRARQQT